MEQVVVERDLEMRTSDGVTLRANVFRAADGDPAPVLLMRTPYGKDGTTPIHLFEPAAAVRRGFVVVVQDVRGRFGSDGVWDPYTAEARDGFDVVQWAAQLPWCNGTVGMYGSSYQGAVQLAAASARPPALRAIAPSMCWLHADQGYSSRGGAAEIGKLVRWTLMNMPNRLRRRLGESAEVERLVAQCERDHADLSVRDYLALPLGRLPILARYDPDSEVFSYLDAADRGDRDQPRLTSAPHSRAVPALWIAGWFDAFAGDMIAGFAVDRSAGLASELVVGPWSHANRTRRVGEADFGPAGDGVDGVELGETILDWFERTLLGSGRPVPSPVRTFEMGQMGEGPWHSADAFPSGTGDLVELYLDAAAATGGTAGLADAPGEDAEVEYRYNPDDPVPTVGGATLMGGGYVAGPADQTALAGRADVLAFATAPLINPVRIEEWVSAELWFGTDAPSTDVVARLVDIAPDGRCLSITDGIRRIVRDGNGLAPVSVDMWATHHTFAAGHRIGLHVTSSSFPRWNRNLNSGEPMVSGVASRVATQQLGIGRSHPSRLITGRRGD